MPKQLTRERSHISGRDVRPFEFTADQIIEVLPHLQDFGIAGLDDRTLRAMTVFAQDQARYAMDDLQPLITTASIATPIQFLQNWLPGFVRVLTQARKADELIGMSTMGSWEDEEIVQGVAEQTGTAVPYGDLTNVPLSSWNVNWAVRTVIRFEEGMRVGRLEEARASRIKISSSDEKRESAALQLEIMRNTVAFYGYNSGDNQTYGILNDPGLPSATDFPGTGTGGSSDWSQKSVLEIIADLILGLEDLRVQSGDTIDPYKDPCTIGVPVNEMGYLNTPSDFGFTANEWLQKNYKQTRIVSVPQFLNAVGGVSVCYFFAEHEGEGGTSSDDKKTWLQCVPSKFQLLGVQQMAKGYEEDYANATAGVMLKRPYALARYLY